MFSVSNLMLNCYLFHTNDESAIFHCRKFISEGPRGEQRYSSTLSRTSALHRVRGQRHASAALYLREETEPILQEAGWDQGPG